MDKKGSFKLIFIALFASLLVGVLWDKVAVIKTAGHYVLDPTAGALLGWNLEIGMIILIFIITLVITLLQKYATDQKAIKEMKKEQKALQEQMKEHKNNPQKLMELNKQQMDYFMKMMPMTMRPVIYTTIPIVLFFRWFYDFFNVLGNPKFFGFFSWFWFYILISILFSIILRKALKVE